MVATPQASAPKHAPPAIDVVQGRALRNLQRLQAEDGAWPGDYGGPMFLLPMYVGLCHAAGRPPERGADMVRYLYAVQRPDGSFGLSAADSRSSMFCSALCYVALRLLGAPADEPRVARLRAWVRARGGPLGAAPWGKFTLCLLGLYEWEGLPPVLPELWLLPRSAPFHPGKLWCHCRQVYLPMAWLYGSRATAERTALIRALRTELYDDYERVDWAAQQERMAAEDSYRKPSMALTLANRAMRQLEARHSKRLRAHALGEVHAHIVYEDEVTSYVDIGPVNKVLDAFVHFFSGDHARFERAFAACDEYLWVGHDGTKMQSYNSSKLWDTAFAMQAIAATGPHLSASATPMLARAYGYVRDNQILEDVPEAERFFRHPSRGGWPFSNRAHGWPITDCTAEGLQAALQFEAQAPAGTTTIPESLLHASAQLMLSWQNDDGGFATYERKRGGDYLELLNPSQVFGDIMVDYSYVECTSAIVRGLRAYTARFGTTPDIERSIKRAGKFLRGQQRSDGSFEGSWAVCFTYGTWFGVSGLLAAGASPKDRAVVRACDFLASKQRADGSFGEHGESCRERKWVEAEHGQVVQTAWVLSTFARAGLRKREADRAAAFLMKRQGEDGSYPREPMVGVFNKTCLIDYDNYRHYFPLWALSEWASWR